MGRQRSVEKGYRCWWGKDKGRDRIMMSRLRAKMFLSMEEGVYDVCRVDRTERRVS